MHVFAITVILNIFEAANTTMYELLLNNCNINYLMGSTYISNLFGKIAQNQQFMTV